MTIKVFRSSDFGAPTNTSAAGSVIGILDAVLVNGYGSQTVSITRNGNTAIVTTPVAHNLKNDTFVVISGANQSEYNGEFQITVTGSTSYSFAVTGTPVSPATGTITAKVASAGWTKPFSGTNLAGYKQGAGSNGMFLRVNDTSGATQTARLKGCENMTDINGTVADFPIELQFSGGLYLGKANSTTPLDWIIIASETYFYFLNQTNSSSNYRSTLFFGDIESNKPGDAFNTMIIGGNSTTSYYNYELFSQSTTLAEMTAHYIARPHTQIGASRQNGKTSTTFMGNSSITSMGNGGIAYPSPLDGALHLAPVLVTESNVGVRGTMPRLWCPLHFRPFSHQDIIEGSGQFEGKKFMALAGGYSTEFQCLIDISNP
jgi:hypothetical protein